MGMLEDDLTETNRMGERDNRIEHLKRELIEVAKAVANGTACGINVIKAYRAATGSSLAESKAWWDSIKVDRSEPAPSELSSIRTRLEVLEKWQRAFDAALDGRKS